MYLYVTMFGLAVTHNHEAFFTYRSPNVLIYPPTRSHIRQTAPLPSCSASSPSLPSLCWPLAPVSEDYYIPVNWERGSKSHISTYIHPYLHLHLRIRVYIPPQRRRRRSPRSLSAPRPRWRLLAASSVMAPIPPSALSNVLVWVTALRWPFARPVSTAPLSSETICLLFGPAPARYVGCVS